MSFDRISKLRFFKESIVFFTMITALVLLSSHSTAFADNFTGPTDLSSKDFKDLNINGNSNLNQISADSLTVKGPLNFSRIKIKGDTNVEGATSGEEADFNNLAVRGSFWATKVEIQNLKVDGEAALENFKVRGKVDINGPLKAKNGDFFKDINAAHTPIALYNVTVDNINVKNSSPGDVDYNNTSKTGNTSNTNTNGNTNNDDNVVKLAGNTVVNGNITFESGNGIVFIRDKTVQFKGKVIGGKIQQQ